MKGMEAQSPQAAAGTRPAQQVPAAKETAGFAKEGFGDCNRTAIEMTGKRAEASRSSCTWLDSTLPEAPFPLSRPSDGLRTTAKARISL
jgi:hypothetical protein